VLTNPDGSYIARPNLFTGGAYRARTVSAVSAQHPIEIVGEPPEPELTPPVDVVGRLAQLGYAVPPPGSRTKGSIRQSVYAFQKAQGLSVDGVVGPHTRARLRSPHPVQPRFTRPGDHLEVDKPRQLLLVVRNGRVAGISNASTAGIPGYSTPEGTFRVLRRVEGLDTSPLGRLWNPLYFYRGWAIHGSTNVPPRPASHGCVRVPLWEAERLFRSVPHGEVVYVY
jgi:hypothetical protein